MLHSNCRVTVMDSEVSLLLAANTMPPCTNEKQAHTTYMNHLIIPAPMTGFLALIPVPVEAALATLGSTPVPRFWALVANTHA